MIPVGVQIERNNALEDARALIAEYGDDIDVYIRTEDDVERDSYGSIKRRKEVEPILMKAYPITYNPTEHQLFKAGLREKVDCMVYTAMRDWIAAEVLDPYFDIDITRVTVFLRGKTYLVKEKSNVNQFADAFLNIALGLVIR